MKGGARLRLDLDEGRCETLHEGWCESTCRVTKGSGDEGKW